MGLFESLTSGVSNVLKQTSPLNLISSGGKTVSGLANETINSMANSAMRGLLGMDTTMCPGGSGYNRNGYNSRNDPCGRNDTALKGAILDLGMAVAGPTLSKLGSIAGGELGSGLSKISSGIGTGFSAVAGSVSSVTGVNKDIIGSAMGAGVTSVANGQSAVIGSINGATQGITVKQTNTTSTANDWLKGAKDLFAF